MITHQNPFELEARARYLLNVSVFLKNAEQYDEVQLKAQSLMAEASRIRQLNQQEFEPIV